MIEIDEYCVDCGEDVFELKEYFHVQDEVWAAATGGSPVPEGKCLCIGCLERRLGRALSGADFTDAPCNWLGERSERFTSRITAR